MVNKGSKFAVIFPQMRGETDCYGCDDGARADGQWEAEGHFAVFGIWRDFVLQSALTPGGQELATQVLVSVETKRQTSTNLTWS